MQNFSRKAHLTLVLGVLMLAGMSDAVLGNESRRVSVVGRATVEAVPDKATVRMAVVRTAPQATSARDEVGKVVAAFLQLCDELSIERGDVDTTGVRVTPQYRRQRDPAQEPALTGYRVTRDLIVQVKDLQQLGALIERAITLGANQASPPRFEVSEKEALHQQALRDAASNARERAKVLSETLGAQLGPVHEIIADELTGRPMPEMYARAAMDSSRGNGAEETYDPGRITIEASIRAVFELRLPMPAED